MDMSNPFEDLETYLANALNLDADIAGILLGMALTIPLGTYSLPGFRTSPRFQTRFPSGVGRLRLRRTERIPRSTYAASMRYRRKLQDATKRIFRLARRNGGDV